MVWWPPAVAAWLHGGTGVPAHLPKERRETSIDVTFRPGQAQFIEHLLGARVSPIRSTKLSVSRTPESGLSGFSMRLSKSTVYRRLQPVALTGRTPAAAAACAVSEALLTAVSRR
jgi:hypothetical protein